MVPAGQPARHADVHRGHTADPHAGRRGRRGRWRRTRRGSHGADGGAHSSDGQDPALPPRGRYASQGGHRRDASQDDWIEGGPADGARQARVRASKSAGRGRGVYVSHQAVPRVHPRDLPHMVQLEAQADRVERRSRPRPHFQAAPVRAGVPHQGMRRRILGVHPRRRARGAGHPGRS